MAKLNSEDKLLLMAASKSIRFFVVMMLKAEPTEDQETVLNDIDNGERKISIRSGHGTGKTSMLSWIILWWGLFKDDAKIPMTAPAAPQLYDLLLPEIRKWRDKLPLQLKKEVDIKSERVDFENGNFAVARTARKDQPEALQGFHATNILFIIDEASGIPQNIFEVVEGALTTDGSFVVMTANPTRVEGYFYDSHHKNRWQWSVYQFNAENSKNVSKAWIAEKKRQYGENSDVYRVRVKGDFPKQSSDAVFSLDKIEDAQQNEQFDSSGAEVWALDVADFGDDKSVLVKRKGLHFYEVKTKEGADLATLKGWLLYEYNRSVRKPSVIFVDAIGLGSGLPSVCHEAGLDIVIGVKASHTADDSDTYQNKRAEWYYKLEEALEDAKLPDDDELVGELMAQRYFINTYGKIQLVDKKQIKKDLGRSPDKADAFAISMNTMIYDESVYEEEYDLYGASISATPYSHAGGVW